MHSSKEMVLAPNISCCCWQGEFQGGWRVANWCPGTSTHPGPYSPSLATHHPINWLKDAFWFGRAIPQRRGARSKAAHPSRAGTALLATTKLSIMQQQNQTHSPGNLSSLVCWVFFFPPSPTEMSSSLLSNMGWEVASDLQGRLSQGFHRLLPGCDPCDSVAKL